MAHEMFAMQIMVMTKSVLLETVVVVVLGHSFNS